MHKLLPTPPIYKARLGSIRSSVGSTVNPLPNNFIAAFRSTEPESVDSILQSVSIQLDTAVDVSYWAVSFGEH
jgi:hypothetical protein